MPVIRLNNLRQDLTQDQLRALHMAVVEAAVSVKELELKGEGDMLVLFPADMMKYGAGTEIWIEIAELWDKLEQMKVAGIRLSENIIEAVEKMFPEARVYSSIALPPE